MNEYKIRTTEITIIRSDSNLNSPEATIIAIVDEGAGEFVTIGQGDQMVSIDVQEWDRIMVSVNNLITDIEYKYNAKGGGRE